MGKKRRRASSFFVLRYPNGPFCAVAAAVRKRNGDAENSRFLGKDAIASPPSGKASLRTFSFGNGAPGRENRSPFRKGSSFAKSAVLPSLPQTDTAYFPRPGLPFACCPPVRPSLSTGIAERTGAKTAPAPEKRRTGGDPSPFTQAPGRSPPRNSPYRMTKLLYHASKKNAIGNLEKSDKNFFEKWLSEHFMTIQLFFLPYFGAVILTKSYILITEKSHFCKPFSAGVLPSPAPLPACAFPPDGI